MFQPLLSNVRPLIGRYVIERDVKKDEPIGYRCPWYGCCFASDEGLPWICRPVGQSSPQKWQLLLVDCIYSHSGCAQSIRLLQAKQPSTHQLVETKLTRNGAYDTGRPLFLLQSVVNDICSNTQIHLLQPVINYRTRLFICRKEEPSTNPTTYISGGFWVANQPSIFGLGCFPFTLNVETQMEMSSNVQYLPRYTVTHVPYCIFIRWVFEILIATHSQPPNLDLHCLMTSSTKWSLPSTYPVFLAGATGGGA